MTDCDMHSRLTMGEYEIFERRAGLVYDVASSLEDLEVLYRQKKGPNGEIGEPRWKGPNAVQEDGDELKNFERVKRDELQQEEGKGEDTEHAAWSLAALFAPHSSSTKSNSAPRPSPDHKLWEPDTPASRSYTQLTDMLDRMQGSKNSNNAGRNTWQARQSGGQGEPFYRDR